VLNGKKEGVADLHRPAFLTFPFSLLHPQLPLLLFLFNLCSEQASAH
jgi:hypothetical protein